MESFMIAGAMADSQDDFLPFLQKLYDRALAARHAARADLDRTVLDGTKARCGEVGRALQQREFFRSLPGHDTLPRSTPNGHNALSILASPRPNHPFVC